MSAQLPEELLLQMIVDAQKACYLEYMCCPWCSGHIGKGSDWHDDFCLWPKVAQRMGIPPVGKDLTPLV